MAANEPFSEDDLASAACLAGLRLDADRIRLLKPLVERLLAGVESLSSLGIEAEAPATVFDVERE